MLSSKANETINETALKFRPLINPAFQGGSGKHGARASEAGNSLSPASERANVVLVRLCALCVSMGAKQSCAKRVDESKEHRTFDLLVPTGVSEGDKPASQTSLAPTPTPTPVP